MSNLLIRSGKLTFFGIVFCVCIGFILVYLSLEHIPWIWGRIVGLSIGLAVAAVGGFSGRADALDLPAPFTNDPLGWREAKKSYETQNSSDESVQKGEQS